MHYLSEEHVFIFLVQLFVVLTAAKILGSLFHKKGMPSLAGEIIAGIILGPTIFGRFFPHLHSELFPSDLIQQNMLETVSWIGLLYLLLVTGFEVHLSSALKNGSKAFVIALIGILVPFVITFLSFYWQPDMARYMGPETDKLSFTVFLSIAASIGALAVIARVLHDLEIIKSDLGFLTLSVFIVNDLIGWLLFAVYIGFVSQKGNPDLSPVFQTMGLALLFGAFSLTIGSRLVGAATKRLYKMDLPQPATIVTFISLIAIVCGAATQWIGVHAIIGFFFAGIMAGNANEISERTREIISQMVHSVFVPVFFASIALKVDFIKNIDIYITILFTVIAISGKFAGAWIGARMIKVPKDDALSLGIAFITGGAMEIILGLLALELGIISEITYVAIVFGAVLSSVLVGPLLSISIKSRDSFLIGSYLHRESIITELKGNNKNAVISELCSKISPVLKNISCSDIQKAVYEREELMGTGMEKGLAVPHGRLDKLDKPVIAFGRSYGGVDWDSADGSPAHFIFMILLPQKDENKQVQILASIARTLSQPEYQSFLLQTSDHERIYQSLKKRLKENSPKRKK
ncbi:MAG TPA: cation:proton antiporter [Clostridiales bacterium]|nr:cation:proton antiporter [Clostridiales bacterium]HQP69658.1 cation:proton antiporter [Clostridiales bacterium]